MIVCSVLEETMKIEITSSFTVLSVRGFGITSRFHGELVMILFRLLAILNVNFKNPFLLKLYSWHVGAFGRCEMGKYLKISGQGLLHGEALLFMIFLYKSTG